jgi:hypothetical protein
MRLMKLALFGLFACITAFTYWLRHINLRYLSMHGSKVPEGFDGAIDEEKLRISTAYTLDSSRLGLWDSLFDNVLLILFLFGGVLAVYDRFVGGLSASVIVAAVLFFLLLTVFQTLLGLPFDLYGTFVIEARYTEVVGHRPDQVPGHRRCLAGLSCRRCFLADPVEPSAVVALGMGLYGCLQPVHDVHLSLRDRAAVQHI